MHWGHMKIVSGKTIFLARSESLSICREYEKFGNEIEEMNYDKDDNDP